MMEFLDAYPAFIESQLKVRRSDEVVRLKSGLSPAETRFLQRVWWPAFQMFDGLFPQYAVKDFKDGTRYIDFAYVQPSFRVAIEIDGIGSHWKDITKWQFSDHCRRQNHLVIDGWHVLRFAYLDVDENPKMCQQTIQQLLGRLTGRPINSLSTLGLLERNIVRYILASTSPVTPRDVALNLGISTQTAHKYLHNLVEQSWLEPVSGSVRIRSYQVHTSRGNILL